MIKMSSKSIISLILTIKFLILFHNGSVAPQDFYNACNNTFTCGDAIRQIGYPFRGVNVPAFCGHPGFILQCHIQNYTTIEISNVSYNVLDINQNNHTMRILRQGTLDGECPLQMENTTLDFSLFDYADSSMNITLLYGCPELPRTGLAVPSCRNDVGSVYVVPGNQGRGNCEASVIVPVDSDEYRNQELMNFTGFGQVLSSGFEIMWKFDSKPCSDCVESNGRCGFDLQTNHATCLCRDQPYVSETCPLGETSQPSSPSPGSVNDDNKNSTRTIIIIVVPVVASLIIIVFIGCFIMRKKQKLQEATQDELAPYLLEDNAAEEISIFEYLQYDFRIFKAATNDFSEDNKLGQGGFGAVYKGTLPNGQEIAVKRLALGSHQGDLEFKNEVTLLVKLQHRNLVRLLGYSCEGTEKLLVYEFVQNASLDAFIFDTTKRSMLDWDGRYKIIGGIARGILYLHEDSRLTIIHRDLKAGNVLLDGNMNPKIADFGTARLFVPDETQGSTNRIVGTYGYMAPEYAMHGGFSVKSDVFSFGVLLLEIISGQKNNCFRHRETKADLISIAWENWRQGTAANLVDPLLNVGSSVPIDILRCIHIGLLCVQENAVDRPTMASVITMLNSFSIPLPVPSHPAFFVHNRYDSEALPLQEFNWEEENSNGPRNNNRAESVSQNEMTISEFQAR